MCAYMRGQQRDKPVHGVSAYLNDLTCLTWIHMLHNIRQSLIPNNLIRYHKNKIDAGQVFAACCTGLYYIVQV